MEFTAWLSVVLWLSWAILFLRIVREDISGDGATLAQRGATLSVMVVYMITSLIVAVGVILSGTN